jgi:hypothetical protein
MATPTSGVDPAKPGDPVCERFQEASAFLPNRLTDLGLTRVEPYGMLRFAMICGRRCRPPD